MENAPLDHPSLRLHRSAIQFHATEHGLPAELVAAIVLVESGGDTYAWNPEPHYRYVVNVQTGKPFRRITGAEGRSERPPDDFPVYVGDRDAEWWGQQASWGLMQVMGAVARELGMHRTDHIPMLADPDYGLNYGCKHLANLVRRFGPEHGWHGAVAAYNAGSPRYKAGRLVNQVYVDKVIRALGPAELEVTRWGIQQWG